MPWLIGWDFNIIRNESEKVGGLLQASWAKADFNGCIHDCALLDLPFKGNRLSWCNGRLGGRRIWARSDRVLVNMQFLNLFGDANISYLPKTSSDHSPMLMQLFSYREVCAWPFRFLLMWGSHDGFLPLVRQVWEANVEGCAMVQISKKLKRLKGVLLEWNREVFGRVEVEIKRLEDRIIWLEEEVSRNFSVQSENELMHCKQEHLKWVHREEILACQKSRIKSLTEGDSNTSIFHDVMRVKKKIKK